MAKIQDEFYPLLYTPRKKNAANNETNKEAEVVDTTTPSGQELQNQLSSLDDFVSESEEELDDITDIPQSML